jgi:hypothetical protein
MGMNRYVRKVSERKNRGESRKRRWENEEKETDR